MSRYAKLCVMLYVMVLLALVNTFDFVRAVIRHEPYEDLAQWVVMLLLFAATVADWRDREKERQSRGQEDPKRPGKHARGRRTHQPPTAPYGGERQEGDPPRRDTS